SARSSSWWRPPSSVRSCRTWSPGCWPRRSRRSHPSAGSSPPRTSALAPAPATLAAAPRRFSSASTPLVLTVALSCTLFFSTTTIDHATTQQRQAALTGQLALTSAGPGLPAAALADARAMHGVRSAVALTSTTLGPGPGAPDDTTPAQILAGGQGGGLDAGVIAGSLSALHGDAIALGRHRADAVRARVGDRMT